MKLQKLLKKLALPVFALVVVSMLAACSSPSGGGSGSNGGGGGDKTPELDSKKEYEISTDNMPDEVKEVLEKALEDAGIEASDSLTGAEIEEIKDALSEAGYTYTEKDGTITIVEKPASSSGSVTPVSSDPLFEITDLTVTATKFEWTEGEWLVKFIEEVSNGEKMFSEGKIKADASGIKWTEMKVTIKDGIIPDSATPEEIAQQKALGYEINGNKYSATMVAGSKDVAKENETILEDFERYQTYQSFKTNAAKTKYYWEKISSKDKGTSTKKYYLEKKSGTSTPVTLPESGSSSYSDDPTGHATSTPDTNISFTGKFQGTVSGYTSGSYVTYNIYIESTNKADYDVTLYETGLEFSPYFKDKGTIDSKDETPTVTVYKGKGTGHSLFITTYEEGEMEVSISLSSGLNYKGPITTPGSSGETQPGNGGGTVSNDEDESATLPEGIEANKEYTVTVLGQAKQMDGYAFAMMVALYNLDKDDYTVSGTNITITESGASKVFKLPDDYYAIVYDGESIFAMAEEELEDFAKSANLQESDYTRDDEAKQIILTAEGYGKAMAFMGKTGGIQSL